MKKIRSHGFKTDSILRQIIEDVITDVYEIPFIEFGKTGQWIAFKWTGITNQQAEMINST